MAMKHIDAPDVLKSSQSFVRALKLAADPPYENSPCKIEIARLGWDSQNLYLPRKADFLLEWILARFHKEKHKTSYDNPLIDHAHWTLLADILACPGDTNLVTLVTHNSIPNIVSSLLALCPTVPDSSRGFLFPPVLRSLAVLWPLAVQRAGVDALSECFWTSLSVFSQVCDTAEWDKIVDIFTLSATAFRSAIANANTAGKKKAHIALVQHHIHPWLQVMHLLPSTHPFHSQIYSLGVEILFNPDSLRTSLETNTNPNANPDIFFALFGSAMKSNVASQVILIKLLPHLMASYLEALHKYRSAIHVDSSTGQQGRSRLRHAAADFGTACLEFLEESMAAPDAVNLAWSTIAGILAVFEEENVFNFAENTIFAEKLREVAKIAIKLLDRAWDGSLSNLVSSALDALSCLHVMEPDILTPFIHQLLERLAICPATVEKSSIGFLSRLISYHSKTRTLHVFISRLLAALASAVPLLPHSDIKTTYGTFANSPLFSLSFTNELGASLRNFMSPGQADAILSTVHEALESSVPALCAPVEPAKKRRKLDIGEVASSHPRSSHEIDGQNVVKFALTAQLSTTALTAVLHGSGRGADAERRKRSLSRIDTMLSSVLEASFKNQEETDREGSGQNGKRARHLKHSGLRWSQECFSAALLRLWYDLFSRSGSPGLQVNDNTWATPEILDHLEGDFFKCLRDGEAQPELHLEIGRVLFVPTSRGPRGHRVRGTLPTSHLPEEHSLLEGSCLSLEIILDYIEQNFCTSSVAAVTTPPAGRIFAILSKEEAALALWHLALERHLDVIDMYASQKQLKRLTTLMLRTRTYPHAQTPASFALTRALTSASFWEFSNIHRSILMVLDERTDEFAGLDIQEWLSPLVRGEIEALRRLWKANEKALRHAPEVIDIYRFMHYLPPEYLSGSFALKLAMWALTVDVFARVLDLRNPDAPLYTEWQATLRSFVVNVKTQTQSRTFDEIASIGDWIQYLTSSKHSPKAPTQEFISSTLKLLSLIHRTCIRAALSSEGKEHLLIDLLTYYLQSDPFVDSSERLAQSCLVGLLSTLVCEFKVSSFSTEVLGICNSLCSQLDDTLGSAIEALAHQTSVTDFLQSAHVIDAWKIFLSFKQWLSIGQGSAAFDETIVKRTASIVHMVGDNDVPVAEEFFVSVLSLVAQQGRMFPEAESKHVNVLAAAYVLFTKSAPAACLLCDKVMVQAIKSFSVIQFGNFLDLIAEAMERQSDQPSETELISLLHLSKLSLKGAPERTSKLRYEHAARCLRMIVKSFVFINASIALSTQTLDFIHAQCINRAESLKLSDVASIWSIFTGFLVGSREHNNHTSTPIFQTIASTVNVLIRFRRDLISSHLPQLSSVLRQLITVIRGVRPFLGIKQYNLVADKLPKWINPSEPLGDEEARTLARVLTALTTKTLIRSHSLNDNQKTESLARPFTRHAPYVLLVYLELMNDPLSVLPVTMRRELEPGLFALCSMMGEHGRDTLMAQSLDIGGKSLFKSLWKVYDKQKYAGKG